MDGAERIYAAIRCEHLPEWGSPRNERNLGGKQWIKGHCQRCQSFVWFAPKHVDGRTVVCYECLNAEPSIVGIAIDYLREYHNG